MSIRVAVHGASGRMGRAVIAAVTEAGGAVVSAALERSGAPSLGEDAGSLAGLAPLGVPVTDDLGAALAASDAVVDFSLPKGTHAVLTACRKARVPAVVGTTGLGDAVATVAEELAAVVPVVIAPNFSQGITLLFHLAAQAAARIGGDFDAEILELHHRHKVDAPSGTAVRLGEVVARARGLDPAEVVCHGRSGHVGARPRSEVGVLALRGGDVVGEHTLFLAGEGERLEITHRATSRSIFARGALRAALWAVGQSPGLYDMTHVMGIGDDEG